MSIITNIRTSPDPPSFGQGPKFTAFDFLKAPLNVCDVVFLCKLILCCCFLMSTEFVQLFSYFYWVSSVIFLCLLHVCNFYSICTERVYCHFLLFTAWVLLFSYVYWVSVILICCYNLTLIWGSVIMNELLNTNKTKNFPD